MRVASNPMPLNFTLLLKPNLSAWAMSPPVAEQPQRAKDAWN